MGLNTLGWWPFVVAVVSGLGLLLALGTGCQTTKSKQTLPPMTSQWDEVQYFPQSPEFVLSEETLAYENEILRQEPPHSTQPSIPKP